MEQDKKQYKDALRSEVSPLLIGVRNEVKALLAEIAQLRKERAEADGKTVDVQVLNPVSEVRFTNQQVDPRPNIENVESAVDEQTERVERSLNNFGEYMKSAGYGVATLLKSLKDRTFEVKVTNPTKEVTVTNLSDIKQPTSVRISNSLPSEAIPVVLTTRDRKRFYEVLTTLSEAGAKANVSVGDIIANLDDVEALLQEILDVSKDILSTMGGGADTAHAHGTLTVSGLGTAQLCSYTVPTGRTVELRGVSVSGVDDGIFVLSVDGVPVWQARNSWTNRALWSGIQYDCTAGQLIEVEVTNLKTQPREFSATFYGISQ